MENPLFGSCSFIYPSWVGLVYSSSTPENSLAEYAQKYRMVEIDRWFWSLGKQSAGLPDASTVHEYDQATDPLFRFTIKCPNALTLPFIHGTKEANPYYLNPDFMAAFIETLNPIREKIGLLMLQFGYLNMSIPLGIELRNPEFIRGSWFQFLQEQYIAPVLLSGYWMDDITSTIDRFHSLFGPTVSIRLHGEDRKEIEKDSNGAWDKIIYDRQRDLNQIATRLMMLKEKHQLFVAVNNHYEGSSPLTIARIEKIMKNIESKVEFG